MKHYVKGFGISAALLLAGCSDSDEAKVKSTESNKSQLLESQATEEVVARKAEEVVVLEVPLRKILQMSIEPLINWTTNLVFENILCLPDGTFGKAGT